MRGKQGASCVLILTPADILQRPMSAETGREQMQQHAS
jgi:hypothetical protein